MFEILLYFIVVGLAFAAGYIYRELKLFSELQVLKADLNLQLKQDLNTIVQGRSNKLRYETVDGTNYFYNELDNTFVAQGRTLDDAAAHYSLVCGKDSLGWFHHADSGKSYCFVDGDCKEYVNEQH